MPVSNQKLKLTFECIFSIKLVVHMCAFRSLRSFKINLKKYLAEISETAKGDHFIKKIIKQAQCSTNLLVSPYLSCYFI
jgi:hypothetical protein